MIGHWAAATAEDGWRKGPWTAQEDKLLSQYVNAYGEGRWNNVARFTGLKRNGKSCRLRWVNYLRPDLKKGQITPKEEKIILELHAKWGNRWSQIAKCLKGRTDNEIKNYWRTHFKKKTKPSPENPEKEKAKLLKRQQFHLQQYHQVHEQQGQSSTGNFTSSWVSESKNHPTQETLFPNATRDEKGMANPYPVPNNHASVGEGSNEDPIMWEDGLWDWDDLLGSIDLKHDVGTSNR